MANPVPTAAPTAIPASDTASRCASPRVQAKMEAIGLVDVDWPFWCCREWRVTVPWAASASTVRHETLHAFLARNPPGDEIAAIFKLVDQIALG